MPTPSLPAPGLQLSPPSSDAPATESSWSVVCGEGYRARLRSQMSRSPSHLCLSGRSLKRTLIRLPYLSEMVSNGTSASQRSHKASLR